VILRVKSIVDHSLDDERSLPNSHKRSVEIP
jgi:hypothetical protein